MFCAALEVELESVDGIQFHREYNLTRKPLQIDIVIVDEEEGKDEAFLGCPLPTWQGPRSGACRTDREEGKGEAFLGCLPSTWQGPQSGVCRTGTREKEERRKKRHREGLPGILRRYNIIEYKSPDDTLSVNDFYKVMSYAGLFKSESPREDEIKAGDIAVILVSSKRPLKLLKYLRDYCRMKVEEVEKGIYECKGNWIFKTYVVIAHPRYGGAYPWLNSLSKELKMNDRKKIERLLEEADERKDSKRDAILELVLKANPEMAGKMKEDDDMRAIQALFAPELAAAEERAEKRGEKRGQNSKLVSLVCRKLRKGKGQEVIAEELEEDPGLIKVICQAARIFAPEYEEEKVFGEFTKILEKQ